MSPETLQSFGILAIGLGFVLIGLGGFSTYHASQKLQHAAELRQVEQKGQMDAQILTLLLKNQQLQTDELQRKTAASAPAPAPEPPPPTTYYYRPPSPPPPPTYTYASPAQATPPPSPPPVAEETAPAEPPSTPEPAAPRLDPMEPARASDWEEPESMQPEVNSRYLTLHQKHVIADTLRAHGPHTVSIESSYGDSVSREFAEELAGAFNAADWIVRGVDVHRGLPLASGVTVSAGSFPPKAETRAVYEALLAAGIAVTQQLDPKQHTSETIILVGAPL